MKKILSLIFVSMIGIGATLTSCGGGAKYTPEQLDSIARAVGPDSLLMNVKDAKYVVATKSGICGPDSMKLYIQAFNGDVYSTNVAKVGDEWTNIMENTSDKLSVLNNSVGTTLPEAVFTPDAKALTKQDLTLTQLQTGCQEEFNAEIEELNRVATAVCKGNWKDTTDGELQSKMLKGQRIYFASDICSDGDVTFVSCTLTPVKANEGLFELSYSILYSGPDGDENMTLSGGEVRFERKDGKFVMVYASKVHKEWAAA